MDTVELKNTKSEIKKKLLDGLRSTLCATTEQVTKLADKSIEIVPTEV